MKEWEGKPKETRKEVRKMIGKEGIEALFVDLINSDTNYEEMNFNRPECKHRIRNLDEHLFLEYWDKEEWEFGIQGDMDDETSEMYFKIMLTLGETASEEELCDESLPLFLKLSKELIDYAKTCENE